ncbi:hypothetical protein MPSEU_000784700 [Mayamaea pseudoterrestris]|nr:hypothetical protein MPSEU_000784700 [Mayamaea pseudoterrestris]
MSKRLNSSGESSAWTPPAWLFPENSSVPSTETVGAGGRRNMNHPYLSVSIPPVPLKVRKAIEAKLSGQGQYFHEKKHINQLMAKLADHRHKLAAMQDKVSELEAQKERGLRDIRVMQEEKTQKALEQIEADMRKQFYDDRERKEQTWKRALQDEFDGRKRQRLQQYKTEDAEAAQKRIESEARILDAVEASDAVKAIRSQAATKRAQWQALQQELETLQETKSEIVWLLKQVIKAEEKNKAKKDATVLPAKLTVPKQA